MQREMASDTILIVDSLNYIKGFRYQMYCAAREMKLRICTVSGLLYHPGSPYSICAGRFSLSPRKTCADHGTVLATANTNMLLRRMCLCFDYQHLFDGHAQDWRTSCLDSRSLPRWSDGTLPFLQFYGRRMSHRCLKSGRR